MLGWDNADTGKLLNASGQIFDTILTSQAAADASASDRAKLVAALNADAAFANASASLYASQALAAAAPAGPQKKTTQDKVTADQTALSIAASAQDAAGSLVPTTLASERIDSARKSLAAAVVKLQADPSNLFNQGLSKAWQTVVDKAANNQIVSADKPGKGGGKKGVIGESWFTQHTIWSAVPNYGVVAGGVGAGALTWYAVKKGIFSRLFGG
jgi:hypothetical protein